MSDPDWISAFLTFEVDRREADQLTALDGALRARYDLGWRMGQSSGEAQRRKILADAAVFFAPAMDDLRDAVRTRALRYVAPHFGDAFGRFVQEASEKIEMKMDHTTDSYRMASRWCFSFNAPSQHFEIVVADDVRDFALDGLK